MFIRKITIKAVAGNPDIVKVKEMKTAGLTVMRVIGRAMQVIKRPSPYDSGDGAAVSYGLKGQFVAWNIDGAQFESTVAFLPAVIHEAVSAALMSAADQGILEVEFGFDVSAVESPRDPNKYEFRALQLPGAQLSNANPFERLLTGAPKFGTGIAQIAAQGTVPSLPAPDQGGDNASAPKATKTPAKRRR